MSGNQTSRESNVRISLGNQVSKGIRCRESNVGNQTSGNQMYGNQVRTNQLCSSISDYRHTYIHSPRYIPKTWRFSSMGSRKCQLEVDLWPPTTINFTPLPRAACWVSVCICAQTISSELIETNSTCTAICTYLQHTVGYLSNFLFDNILSWEYSPWC